MFLLMFLFFPGLYISLVFIYDPLVHVCLFSCFTFFKICFSDPLLWLMTSCTKSYNGRLSINHGIELSLRTISSLLLTGFSSLLLVLLLFPFEFSSVIIFVALDAVLCVCARIYHVGLSIQVVVFTNRIYQIKNSRKSTWFGTFPPRAQRRTSRERGRGCEDEYASAFFMLRKIRHRSRMRDTS